MRSRQIQISVWETYPFQQDVQQFRDIISPDIQEDPRKRRNIKKVEGSEINHLILENHNGSIISVQRRIFLT